MLESIHIRMNVNKTMAHSLTPWTLNTRHAKFTTIIASFSQTNQEKIHFIFFIPATNTRFEMSQGESLCICNLTHRALRGENLAGPLQALQAFRLQWRHCKVACLGIDCLWCDVTSCHLEWQSMARSSLFRFIFLATAKTELSIENRRM